MVALLTVIPAALALLAAAVEGSEFHARSCQYECKFQIYGWGLSNEGASAVSGLPLYYGDGKAYISSLPPNSTNLNNAFNVTFAASTKNTQFIATSPDTTFNDTQSFYIDETASELGDVGFAPSLSNSSLTTTGFGLYGAWIFHVNDDTSAVEMKWYAEETDTDGVYQVKWNNAATSVTSATAISLRTAAPVAPN